MLFGLFVLIFSWCPLKKRTCKFYVANVINNFFNVCVSYLRNFSTVRSWENFLMSNYSFSRCLQTFGLTEIDDYSGHWLSRLTSWFLPFCLSSFRDFFSVFQDHFIFLVTFYFSLIFLGILKCLVFILHFKISISEVIVLLSVAPGGFPWGNWRPCGCSEVWLCVRMFWILSEVCETHIDKLHFQRMFIYNCFCLTWGTGSGWHSRKQNFPHWLFLLLESG